MKKAIIFYSAAVFLPMAVCGQDSLGVELSPEFLAVMADTCRPPRLVAKSVINYETYSRAHLEFMGVGDGQPFGYRYKTIAAFQQQEGRVPLSQYLDEAEGVSPYGKVSFIQPYFYKGQKFESDAQRFPRLGACSTGTGRMPLFCRLEWQLEKRTRLPIRFRIGEVGYVDRLEGKRPPSIH